jgi:hypothetical protein
MAAQLVPYVPMGPPHGEATHTTGPAASTPPSLEELLPLLVKRVAWSGDGRSGAVRLEIGAGALSGATLFVQAEAGRVRIHLELPPGEARDEWHARITSCLARRGVSCDAVEVR